MRIIGGVFKGKKLFLPNDKKTRPLKDLVKESIFNFIQHSNKLNINVNKSLVLDLFSGTGSFGIECLSRGAKKVIFVEDYTEVIQILNKNLKSLKNCDNYQVIKKDCFNFFKTYEKLNYKFDIIFMDPPYKEKKINEILDSIKELNLLNENGIIILHRHKKDSLEISNKIKIFEERFYGISKISYGN